MLLHVLPAVHKLVPGGRSAEIHGEMTRPDEIVQLNACWCALVPRAMENVDQFHARTTLSRLPLDNADPHTLAMYRTLCATCLK